MVTLDDMQNAIEHGGFSFSFGEDVRRRATEQVPPRQDIKLVFYPFASFATPYNFAARLARVAKKPATNWRVSQEVVDRTWDAQDKVRVMVRSTRREENAQRWVDESFRRAREGADG